MLSLRQRSGCGGGDPHARRREACDDRVVPPVDKGRTELMVRVRQIGHVCLVDARGEIDASTVAELHVGLDGALRARTAVVVDLCAVSFMDSAGLHALLVFRQQLLDEGRGVVLACWPDGAVSMALSVSGTDTLFGVHPDRDAAVAAAEIMLSPTGESSDDGSSPTGAYAALQLARKVGAGVLAAAVRTLRSKP